MDVFVEDAGGPAFEGAGGAEGVGGFVVEEDVGAGGEEASGEVVHARIAVAAVDEGLLAVDEEGLAAISAGFGDGGFAARVFDGDAARAMADEDGGADEVPRRDIAHPGVFDVIELDGDPRVVFIQRIFGVVGAVEG